MHFIKNSRREYICFKSINPEKNLVYNMTQKAETAANSYFYSVWAIDITLTKIIFREETLLSSLHLDTMNLIVVRTASNM